MVEAPLSQSLNTIRDILYTLMPLGSLKGQDKALKTKLLKYIEKKIADEFNKELAKKCRKQFKKDVNFYQEYFPRRVFTYAQSFLNTDIVENFLDDMGVLYGIIIWKQGNFTVIETEEKTEADFKFIPLQLKNSNIFLYYPVMREGWLGIDGGHGIKLPDKIHKWYEENQDHSSNELWQSIEEKYRQVIEDAKCTKVLELYQHYVDQKKHVLEKNQTTLEFIVLDLLDFYEYETILEPYLQANIDEFFSFDSPNGKNYRIEELIIKEFLHKTSDESAENIVLKRIKELHGEVNGLYLLPIGNKNLPLSEVGKPDPMEDCSLSLIFTKRKLETEEISYLAGFNTTLAGPSISNIAIIARQEYIHEITHYATKSACSAILSRNLSHNIGSHVMPRTSLDLIKQRLGETKPTENDPHQQIEKERDLNQQIKQLKQELERERSQFIIIKDIKRKLDDYIQEKSDFVAEITTEPLTSTRPAFFYKEIILPLIENPLVMDNIAANEGINYDETLTKNRLKIRVFINNKELRAIYNCKACGETYIYPERLPYSLHCVHPNCRENPSRLEFRKLYNSNEDVEIELPGPLGQYAFYGLLENFIRNTAKHDKEDLTDGKPLEVSIDIAEPTAEKERAEFYEVRIWSNISDPDKTDDKGKTLRERLQGYVKSHPIKKTDGSLRRRAWGVMEMKISTSLLSGCSDFNSLEEKLDVIRYLDPENGIPRLAYLFKVMKSRKLCAVIPSWNDPERSEELKQNGIRIFASVDKLLKHLCSGKSIASYRFAVFDHSQSGSSEEELEAFLRLFPQLPFRVFIICRQDKPDLPTKVQALLKSGAIVLINEKLSLAQSSDKIMQWLWKNWVLARFLKSTELREKEGEILPETNRTVLDVYLDQQSNESPTDHWLKYAEIFNSITPEVNLNVWAKWGKRKRIESFRADARQGDRHILYDRHGRILSRLSRAKVGDCMDKHTYIFFDKLSSDFVNLFNPVIPNYPNDDQDASWVFPWELIEAGLLRILVIDERVAERAYDESPDDRDVIKVARRVLLTKRSLRFHMAWAAKVYICTHLQTNQKMEELHESIKKRNGRPPFLKVSFDRLFDKNNPGIQYYFRIGSNDKEVSIENPKPDMLIIHQSKLDNLGYNQDAFLGEIRKFIPFIVVDSGRGIPHSLKPHIKFLPFSLIQDYLLGQRIAKYSLTRTALSLTRKMSQHHE